MRKMRNAEYSWYDAKYAIKNLWRYRKIVANHRDWDSQYILNMIEFQLGYLRNTIAEGNEVEESRTEKIANMDRCLQLLKNVREDEYMTRCGYKHDERAFDEIFIPSLDNPEVFSMSSNPNHTEDELEEIIKQANDLQEKEWQELLTLAKDLRVWRT